MLTLPITFSLAPFPTGSQMNADQYGQQLVANLTATFSGNFLTGQTGGLAPITDIGPWFNAGQWYVWNTTLGAYAPLVPSYFYETPIINGRMQVWQRQITFPAPVTGSYTADRWQNFHVLSTGVATISQSSANIPGTPTYPATEFSLKIAVTTAQPIIGAGEFFVVSQPVERQFSRMLFDQTTTFSILLKSNLIGKYCISIRSSDSAVSYVAECNITSAGVFQRFEIQNIPPFPIGANLGTLDTDKGYSVSICVATGATFQSLVPNSWQTGNFLGTVNQANLFSTIGNSLEFTLVKHETGITSSPYCPRPFDEVVRTCQRYYSKSYGYGVFPAALSFANCIVYSRLDTNTSTGSLRFPVSLRIPVAFSSTLSTYSPSTGALSSIFSSADSADRLISAIAQNGSEGFGNITNVTTSSGGVAFFHYTANAEF